MLVPRALPVAAIALLLLAWPGGAQDLPPFVPEAAAGFVVQPLAPLPAPTALAWSPDGDLWATLLSGQVARLDLEWVGPHPLVAGVSFPVTGFSQPLGIVFEDGAHFFVADSVLEDESLDGNGRTDGRVWRVHVEDPAEPQLDLVVSGLPNGRHNTNHMRFGPDGRLYAANGNPNDNGIDGGDPDVFPYSGAILSFDAAVIASSPAVLSWFDENGDPIPPGQIASHAVNADFAAKTEVLAWGFRNVFGVAFHPGTGLAYTGMNGADEPSSQDALFRIVPGTDYGFPFCYNEGPPGGVGSDVEAVTNPTFPGHDCSGVPPATALLGWHTCATGLDFPTEGPLAFPESMRSSVFVGECGPFFIPDLVEQSLEDPPRAGHNTGHKVRRVALDEAGQAVEVRDFLTGLALPTDVLFGPEGAMYVADAGGILRVVPAASPEGP